MGCVVENVILLLCPPLWASAYFFLFWASHDELSLMRNLCFSPAFLFYHLKYATTNVWIGMNDITTESTFLWTDGSTVSYTNWVNGAPEKQQSYFDYYEFERVTDDSLEVQEF